MQLKNRKKPKRNEPNQKEKSKWKTHNDGTKKEKTVREREQEREKNMIESKDVIQEIMRAHSISYTQILYT